MPGRVATQEERDPLERVAEIECAREAGSAGELTVVGRPIGERDAQLFDA
jgi:hypothetical protein